MNKSLRVSFTQFEARESPNNDSKIPVVRRIHSSRALRAAAGVFYLWAGEKGWATVSWIKVRTELHDSPTVVRIVSRVRNAPSVTGLSRTAVTSVVLGGLVRVWSLADTHTADGILSGYTSEIIDELVGVAGFCDALAAEDWMIIEPQAIVIPEFTKHNGVSAKARDQGARRQKSHRDRNAPTVTNVTQSALPEKRREEKMREDSPPPTSPARAPKARAKADDGSVGRSEEVFLLAQARGIGVAEEVACSGWTEVEFRDVCKAADDNDLGNGWIVSVSRRKRNGESIAMPDGFVSFADAARRAQEAADFINGMNGSKT